MRSLFLFILCLTGLHLQAQDKKPSTSLFEGMQYNFGYTGNLIWNNGLTIGADYFWKEKSITKLRKDKSKTITHQLIFNGNIGFTTNFASKTQTALFTNYGLEWRRTNPKGKQIHFSFNPLGYYRSFLPETFEVKGGEVQKVFLPGRSYFAPSLSLGLGKLREGKKLSSRYFSINFMLRTPYNAGSLPSISFQYGYRFNSNKRNNAKINLP